VTTDLLVRTFAVRLEPSTSDGRIIEGRCVPYHVPTLVQDAPDTDPYLEVIYPGAFTRAVRAPDRVQFRYMHRDGLADWIGRGVDFTDTDDGLDGSFRVLPGAFGDHALTLVDEGLLGGLSVGFRSLSRRDRRNAEGAIIRDRCHLVEVSLTPEPAYVGALVTGRRSSQAGVDDVDLASLLPDRDEALDARLRAVGISV